MRPRSRRFSLARIVILVLVASGGCGRSGTSSRVGDDGGLGDLVRGSDDALSDARVQAADGGPGDAGTSDVGVLDAGVPRSDAAVSEVADASDADQRSDALMPPRPDAADSDAANIKPEVGSDAIRPPLDGRLDSDANVADGGLVDTRDAASDGAGLDAGAVDAPETTNEIAQACALAASCSGYGSPLSASRCIQEFGKTASRRDDTYLDRLLDCRRKAMMSATRGCGAFRQCWGGDLITIDPLVVGASCSGKEITFTPSGATSPLRFDCGAMGQECVDPGTALDRAGCGVLSCLVAAPTPPSCEGTVASACSGYGQRPKVDCARSGRTCQVVDQNAVCAGSGTACDAAEKVTCSGSQATYCAVGARATVDCATTSVATRCAAGASSSEPCTAAGTACNPAAFVDVCDGSGLQVCVDGSIATIPCSDIGLVSCSRLTGMSYATCHEGA